MPLQEGIYWGKGATPGSAFGILFLRARSGATAAQVDSVLLGLAQVYDGLRRGLVPDLPGVEVKTGDLTVLFGYGLKAFALPGARRPRPAGLGPQFQFASQAAAGGGSALVGSGLRYAPGMARNPATEEVMIQAIANTELAVARVLVETQKYLDDHPDPTTGEPWLELAAGFTGFNRDDARSWIDFHDGISNLRSGQQRFDAIAIKRAGTPEVDRWTVEGAYLAFMRLSVDLRLWRKLPVATQELMVGRRKTSGCPLDAVSATGAPVATLGCPATAGGTILDAGHEAFREPPRTTDPVIQRSHVQRANHHVGPVSRDSSRRIFRQGYEFIDPPAPGAPLRQGLNFVSFQDSLARLFFMLTQTTWLGGVNFGGDQDDLANPLLHVHAAAVFLCPPTDPSEDYPGRSIFVDVAAAAPVPSQPPEPIPPGPN